MIKIHPEPFISCVVAVLLEDVAGLGVPAEFEIGGEVAFVLICFSAVIQGRDHETRTGGMSRCCVLQTG